MAGEKFGNVWNVHWNVLRCKRHGCHSNALHEQSIVLDHGKQAVWSISWWLMGHGAHMPEDWQQDRQTHQQLRRNPWFPCIKSATVESKSRASRSKSLWTETSVPAWFLPAGCSVQAVIVTSCRNSNGGHLSVGQPVEANRRVFGNYPSSQPVK